MTTNAFQGHYPDDGGLIASLIDCHATGSAAAAMHRHRGGKDNDEIPAVDAADFVAPSLADLPPDMFDRLITNR